MENDEIKGVIENILFVSDTPVTLESFTQLFDGTITSGEITDALEELKSDYESRSLAITEVAEGFRIETRPDYAIWVTRFFKMERGQKLGRAALEALAIAAYRQPITKAEVDDIRGVDSGGAMRGLVDKNLIKSMGRRKTPGKPMMYGTTKRFLEYFGLAKLSDLPTMDEFEKEMASAFPEDTQESMVFNDENEESIGELDPETSLDDKEINEGDKIETTPGPETDTNPETDIEINSGADTETGTDNDRGNPDS